MSDLTFVLALTVDTVASGFIGWLLGRTARNAAVAAQAVTDDADDDAVEPEPTTRRSRARARLARVRAQHVVVLFLVLVGVVTAVQGFSESANRTELNECVVRYSDELHDALIQARESSQDVQVAQDLIWSAVGRAFANPGSDPNGAKIGDAVAAYNRQRTAQRKSQAEHPLPDPPRGACADLLR